MIDQISTLWFGLDFDTRLLLWRVTGIALITGSLIGTYYLLRRLAGHTKFRGVWLSRSQTDALLQQLLADQRETNRTLQYDELVFVRKLLHGSGFKPIFKGRFGGY